MTREDIERNRQYQLTGAAIDYCRKEHPHYGGKALGEITDAFEAGAEWEHKRLVDKVCRHYCADVCDKSRCGMCFHKYDGEYQVKNTFQYNECNELKMIRKIAEE